MDVRMYINELWLSMSYRIEKYILWFCVFICKRKPAFVYFSCICFAHLIMTNYTFNCQVNYCHQYIHPLPSGCGDPILCIGAITSGCRYTLPVRGRVPGCSFIQDTHWTHPQWSEVHCSTCTDTSWFIWRSGVLACRTSLNEDNPWENWLHR